MLSIQLANMIENRSKLQTTYTEIQKYNLRLKVSSKHLDRHFSTVQAK